MSDFVLLTTPAVFQDGHRIGEPMVGKHDIYYNGTLICDASRRPFFDGARALLSFGIARPYDNVFMRPLAANGDAAHVKEAAVSSAAQLSREEVMQFPRVTASVAAPTADGHDMIDPFAPEVPRMEQVRILRDKILRRRERERDTASSDSSGVASDDEGLSEWEKTQRLRDRILREREQARLRKLNGGHDGSSNDRQ